MSGAQRYAHVPLQPETRDKLRAAKVGGESYDDLVNRLLADCDGASRTSDARE